MPLPPRRIVLNRFGLLEQVIGQEKLKDLADPLINSTSTPPIVRDYFNLVREKKELEDRFYNAGLTDEDAINSELAKLNDLRPKFDAFFEKYKDSEPVMVKVCQAHFLMNPKVNTENNWVFAAAKADPDYANNNAGPIIEELKKENLGIAYRMDALLKVNELSIRQDYQIAAELDDTTAKGLLGYDYLSHMAGHAFDGKPYDYSLPSSSGLSPLHSMNLALDAHDPDSVAKQMTYLTNVSNALFELSNNATKLTFSKETVEKQLGYDLVLIGPGENPEPVEKNKLSLSKDEHSNSYIVTMLSSTGEVIKETISEDALGYRIINRPSSASTYDDGTEGRTIPTIDDQKPFLLPDLLKIMSERGHSLTNQRLETLLKNQSNDDSNVIIMLDSAQKIIRENEGSTVNKELLESFSQAQDLIKNKEYSKLPDVKKRVDVLLEDYRNNQDKKVQEMIEDQSKQTLFIDPILRKDLNDLYDHYEQEMNRIESSAGNKRTYFEQTSIDLLKSAKNELLRINDEQNNDEARQLLNVHITTTEANIQKLPHPNAFMRFIETFSSNNLSKTITNLFRIEDTNRVKLRENFASLKTRLGTLKQEATKESTEKTDDTPSRRLSH